MTEAEIRERMNRMSNNLAKVLAAQGNNSSTKAQILTDIIAVFTQLAIDIHKIADRR